jgi:long-chain fatty acid transport protein
MGRLRGTNASGVLNVIQASSKFQNTGSTGAFANPGSGEGGDAGGVAIVPQAYAVTSVDDRLRLGVGLNSPFGLKTEYDAGWRGQLTALRSEQSTYNLNPSVAYRVRDRLWLGAGVSVQRMTTELTNFAGPLGEARLKASDNAWGFNLGALFDVNDDARIGIAYRSAIRFKPSGSATFASGGGTFDSAVRTELTVPETVMLNGLVRFGRDWEVMGGATWTRWSRLGMLTVTRTSASALGPEGSVLATLPFNWRNTVMLAVGANWRLDDNWKLRFGFAHDPAASNDVDRTARLPDQARTLLAVGAHVQGSDDAWKGWSFDASYMHDFVKDARINNSVQGVPGALIGTFRNSANVLSIQANYRL